MLIWFNVNDTWLRSKISKMSATYY
uniref:Uncharacterized protein n=1 Tax=Arundo donax TaxID=35708 RepID=A0A0A9APQ7_ARUDO